MNGGSMYQAPRGYQNATVRGAREPSGRRRRSPRAARSDSNLRVIRKNRNPEKKRYFRRRPNTCQAFGRIEKLPPLRTFLRYMGFPPAPF